jgi:hypothetical protein
MDRHAGHGHGKLGTDGGKQRCLAPQSLFGFLALGEFGDEAVVYVDGEAVPAAAGDREGQAGEGRAGGEDRRPVGIGYAAGDLKFDQ